MKKIVYALGVAALLVSCNSTKTEKEVAAEEAGVDEAVEATVDGNWLLKSYANDGQTVEVAGGQDYMAIFEPSDSTFSIETGCNNIGAKYVAEDGKLTLDNLMMTRMMCPDMTVEEALNKVLPTVNGYEIVEDTLQLTNGEGVVVTLVRFSEPDAE